jgi:hypothetical protein
LRVSAPPLAAQDFVAALELREHEATGTGLLDFRHFWREVPDSLHIHAYPCILSASSPAGSSIFASY